MNKHIKKLLIALIPIRSIRHKLRGKGRTFSKIEDNGKGNSIQLPCDSSVVVRVRGNNNIINVDSKSHVFGCIDVYGDNNKVEIGKGSYTISLYIGVPDCDVSNCKFNLGKNGLINGAVIRLAEDESSVQIGHDCLFSDQINIWNTDTHSILNASGDVLNRGDKIVIGNHVWLGCRATILKNTTIADDCVVAWGSIVTKKFDEPNCVLAGNPAKIVKKGIFWDKERPNNIGKKRK